MSKRPVPVRRRRTIASVFLASVILYACSGEGSTQPTMQSVVGRYSLRTIDGGALPWVNPANTGGTKVEIMGVQLELTSGGTFTESWQFRITSASGVRYSNSQDVGSFTLLGSSLVLLYDTNSARETGSFGTDRLTVTTQGGSTLVYVKQP